MTQGEFELTTPGGTKLRVEVQVIQQFQMKPGNGRCSLAGADVGSVSEAIEKAKAAIREAMAIPRAILFCISTRRSISSSRTFGPGGV